jgi:hypothetical protein
LDDGSDFGDEVDHSRPGEFSNSGDVPGRITKVKTEMPQKTSDGVEVELKGERSSSLKTKHEKDQVTIPDVERAETVDYNLNEEIKLDKDSACVIEGYKRIIRQCQIKLIKFDSIENLIFGENYKPETITTIGILK